MLNKKLTLTIYFLSSCLFAVIYGLISYFGIYRGFAQENALLTYFLNLVFIVIGLILDHISMKYAYSKNPYLTEDSIKQMSALTKILYQSALISFRTSLYAFYMIALILSRVTILEPNLIPFQLGNFLTSVEYGLILLIAADKLQEQLIKDEKRIEKISFKLTMRKSKKKRSRRKRKNSYKNR